MQKNENDLFYFSRKEKNGIVLILIFNLLIYCWPDVYDYFSKKQSSEIIVEKLPQIKEESQLENNELVSNNKSTENNFISKVQYKVEYFNFDPNTCTKEEWMKLGVKEKTAETIIKYISKGGKFKAPEDLKKIWGLSPTQVKELLPFVKIVPTSKIENEKNINVQFSQKNSNKIIDINTADSSLMEWLPGIGPALAGRIIKYRNKLGGFYNHEQLKEVWGLPDSVFQKIKEKVVISDNVQKLNVNNADFLVLKSHPYIGNKLANAIINYRNQHGSFKSLDDIQKIILIDEKTFNRLSHYLITNS
jgi:competence ComEA-like helix-hairpin-helix protein